jgi:hypothetical protein
MSELIVEPFAVSSGFLRLFMSTLHKYFLEKNIYSVVDVWDLHLKFSFDITFCDYPIACNSKILLPDCLYMKVAPVCVEVVDRMCFFAPTHMYKHCGVIYSPTKFYVQVLNSEEDQHLVDIVVAVFDHGIQDYLKITKSEIVLSTTTVEDIVQDILKLKKCIRFTTRSTYHLFQTNAATTPLIDFHNAVNQGLHASASIDDIAWPNSQKFSFFS